MASCVRRGKSTVDCLSARTESEEKPFRVLENRESGLLQQIRPGNHESFVELELCAENPRVESKREGGRERYKGRNAVGRDAEILRVYSRESSRVHADCEKSCELDRQESLSCRIGG